MKISSGEMGQEIEFKFLEGEMMSKGREVQGK